MDLQQSGKEKGCNSSGQHIESLFIYQVILVYIYVDDDFYVVVNIFKNDEKDVDACVESIKDVGEDYSDYVVDDD